MSAPSPAGPVVHLWEVSLEPPAGGAADLVLLSAEERARAERIRVEDAARRHVGARAALRRILGELLQRAPETLVIDLEPMGRPVLRGAPGRDVPWFNVSHSGNLALVGACWSCPVGVDVERLRAVPQAERLAARFFTAREAAAVAAASPAERHAVFLRLFTVKEAVMKEQGTGLTFPLGQVEIADDLARATTTTVRAADGAASWAVALPSVSPGHVAAVAVRCPEIQLRAEFSEKNQL
jgi:4'-phosphopantetheinyl transferase